MWTPRDRRPSFGRLVYLALGAGDLLVHTLLLLDLLLREAAAEAHFDAHGRDGRAEAVLWLREDALAVRRRLLAAVEAEVQVRVGGVEDGVVAGEVTVLRHVVDEHQRAEDGLLTALDVLALH